MCNPLAILCLASFVIQVPQIDLNTMKRHLNESRVAIQLNLQQHHRRCYMKPTLYSVCAETNESVVITIFNTHLENGIMRACTDAIIYPPMSLPIRRPGCSDPETSPSEGRVRDAAALQDYILKELMEANHVEKKERAASSQ